MDGISDCSIHSMVTTPLCTPPSSLRRRLNGIPVHIPVILHMSGYRQAVAQSPDSG